MYGILLLAAFIFSMLLAVPLVLYILRRQNKIIDKRFEEQEPIKKSKKGK